jgi:predicted TIM-barrel fold metal-dependent hydrolase
MTQEAPRIAGPVQQPAAPRVRPPPNAWDAHAHIFGPADKFPYAPGRGYTPPDAPVERYVTLLNHLGFANGLLVQGNAHGFDNRVIDSAFPEVGRIFRSASLCRLDVSSWR